MSKQCTDHLGNTFKSFTDMCKYYNIDINTFYSRLKRGASLKEALTIPVGKNSPKQCTDYLGNTFKSFSDMCKYHNVDYQTAYRHLKAGWTIEEVLTNKNYKQKHEQKNVS